MTEWTEGPATDARSGRQVKQWIESGWPASRVELTESENSYILHVWTGAITDPSSVAMMAYILHVWTGDLCLVLERRGEEWGFTDDLAADEPGFDSGHPLVSGDGAMVLTLVGQTLDRVSES
ncbi:MAG: hypothetical protein KDB26_11130 [Microthrixaceae bacterium]|nr:hypothetical protein [Microthrixaceae bacterium]